MIWICLFFHKWDKWKFIGRGSLGYLWQQRICLRCGKIEEDYT